MTEPTEVQVRPGVEGDLDALTDLYNHYVRETPITFDTSVFTAEERRPWLLSHLQDERHPLLVAQEAKSGQSGSYGKTGRLLGYATAGPFRQKPAYETSVEVTVYCTPVIGVGRGIGTLLYEALFDALADQDLHRAYAGIAQPNDASARLHTRFGFRHVGTYREVGRKFGRYWDVAWYEKRLGRQAQA
ncbi:GNAT family N-acetyltransferase [Streptomyces beihaiensis]|uniref:GNAT family N-acetyltransferase n=1 Tax=Streptomyces beihaiensis TaxID=2984495 RepID=A0ABT3TQY6_9ACTN|nr:GNAT family N-acetyltransferase [Streptomyces beihaiensis]MCX3058453.1 GNAT family N-acetyltransferase [Streptomyces beihaiensis]